MKLYNIENPEEFFQLIDRCEGTVELISKQGDRLNLKSQITKYVALAKMFDDKSMIEELEIVAHNPDDAIRIMKYMYGVDKFPGTST